MTDEMLRVPEHQSQQLPRTKTSWRAMLWLVSTTPLSDLLNGRLTGRPDENAAIAAANLPVELATLIQSVVRATRLWPNERADVARELACHFRDGLDAGEVASDLKDQFGNSDLAARLIRTSRIRCRPTWWHTWRYAQLGMALMLLTYVGLGVRFYLSVPTISRHYIREFNDQVRAIPEEQRAWPLYREALKLRKPYPKLEQGQSRGLEEGWWNTENNRVDRDSLTWKQMLLFVEENQASIERMHQAARRPERGIIYNDPADNPVSVSGEDTPLIGVSINQVHEMRNLAQLLTADATVAISVGDGNRLVSDVQSLILMAEQCRGHWIFEDLISMSVMQITMSAIRDSLEDAPNLLTDHQLVEIAHRLAVYAGGGTIRFDLRGEQSSLDDILQRCYTDDGRGNGSLTPDGLEFLGNLIPASWEHRNDQPAVFVFKAIRSPAVMLRAMSRRESREILARLFEESRFMHRGPLYTWGESDSCQRFFQKERSHYSVGDSTLVPAFSVPLLCFPAVEHYDAAAERLCQVRDGTLTAIALELYHRRHGDCPETLDQLVPLELPELPLDRFTGQTLRYRVQEGRPLVYACGMDQQDDGGRHPGSFAGGGLNYQQIFAKPTTSPVPGSGYDWVLFPRPRRSPQDHE